MGLYVPDLWPYIFLASRVFGNLTGTGSRNDGETVYKVVGTRTELCLNI